MPSSLADNTPAARQPIGEWIFDRPAGCLRRPDEERRLEPKVADLLGLLIDHAGQVVSREAIDAVLWPDVVVGDDALPRCVSKLRRALGDDPKSPSYIETVPKRGYRLLAETLAAASIDQADHHADAAPTPRVGPERVRWAIVAAVVVLVVAGGLGWLSRKSYPPPAPAPPSEGPAARALADRADDFYYQVDRAGNESAIELYERALATDPDFAPAHAGLANALVQRVLRYPTTEDLPPIEPVNLANALASGRLATAEARLYLERAEGLAERAVRLAPEDAASHKALGFVRSALDRPAAAIRSYEHAIELDPNAWDVLINLSDLHEIRGDDEQALAYFEQTYAAMTRVYSEQATRVRPWYADVGVAIGTRHEAAGRPEDAEAWYRRVLGYAPFHPPATCALSRLLRRAGDPATADRLIAEAAERTDQPLDCAASSDQ